MDLFIFIAFLIICSSIFISLAVYLRRQKMLTRIPGMRPSDRKTGNLSDIARCGSLPVFLMQLHKNYGPIASFWHGEKFVVSTTQPDMIRPLIKFFDRPPDFFKFLEGLGPGSIEFTNGDKGRFMRQHLDKPFSHEACEKYVLTINEVMSSTNSKLEHLDGDQPVALRTHTLSTALRSILLISFGDYFLDDKSISDFVKNNDICWYEFERYIIDPKASNDERARRRVEEAKAQLQMQMSQVVKCRKEESATPGFSDTYRFIDALMELSLTEEEEFSNIMLYIIAGFHTTGTLVAWMIYFLLKSPECEEKLRREFGSVLVSEDITLEQIKNLTYCRQVIEESLRLSTLATYTARYADTDTNIRGHFIPKGTPILQAVGASYMDPSLWPEPTKFDPDRFSPDQLKKMDSFAYPFFGFGRRKCPGYRLFYIEATMIIAAFMRKFRIKLADPDQVVTPFYGLVTRPKEEIWVKLDIIKEK